MGKAEQIDVLKAERSTAKGNFTRKANLLEKAIAEKKAAPLIEKLWQETKTYYQEVQGKNDAVNNQLILEICNYNTSIIIK